MRVLVVTRNSPAKSVVPADKGGGADTFMDSLLKLPTSVSDLSIDVVSQYPQGEPIDPPPNVTLQYVRADYIYRWLWTHREAKNPIVSLALLVLAATLLARESLRTARKNRYDLIYAVGGPIAGVTGIVVKWFTRLPLAMHFHVTYRFSAASRFVRFLAKAFYNQTDALIGNCPMQGKDAVALGISASKCHYVFNWIDQSVFRPLEPRSAYRETFGIRPDQTAFYFGGRFCHTKHVDRVIDALRGFDDPRAVFLFAGDGVLGDELRALARENPNVHVLGTISRAELPQLHAAADVQFWGSVDVDYPGLVVMEAMSSGLPVYTSNQTMNPLYEGFAVDPEFLGAPKYARLFPPDRNGIRAAIAEAIERRGELNSIRPDVAAFARRSFGFENALKLVDILRAVSRTQPKTALSARVEMESYR
jgi:glycosyltransferase involved in cell wall biosynthesis